MLATVMCSTAEVPLAAGLVAAAALHNVARSGAPSLAAQLASAAALHTGPMALALA